MSSHESSHNPALDKHECRFGTFTEAVRKSRLHQSQESFYDRQVNLSRLSSARLQLCSVFSQSHCGQIFCHVSTVSLLGLVLLRLLPLPIGQIHSKQRCCILLVTSFQLISSGLNETFGIWNSKSFNTLSTLKRTFPSRRRFKSTGCMASSR